MTLDTLVAFIALLLAAYQIAPKVRQLDLRLRFTLLNWSIVTAAFIIILYLQFYAIFKRIGLAPNFGFWRWNLTPERVSFLVLLVTAIASTVLVRFTRITPSRIVKFRRLVEELLSQRNFTELFTLLERHLDRLVKVAKNDYMFTRIRRRHLDYRYSLERMVHDLDQVKKEKIRPSKTQVALDFVENRLGPIARFLPDRTKESMVAHEILRLSFTSKEAITSLVKIRPYLALDYLKHNLPEKDVFLDHYLRSLLTDSSSVLYYEVRRNMESGGHWYLIPSSNRLIHFFFEDAKVAEKYHVWRPIGETAIAELDRLGRKPENDPYNLEPDRDFDDFVKWESPIYVSLLLFDIMVTQALRQNINWHMCLYYLAYITEKIVRNYKPAFSELISDDTYRNRYNTLLDRIFSQLTGWVRSIEWLPVDQSNITLRRVSSDHENDNIPKSSIIALGDCLNHLLTAENIGNRFKRSISHSVFDLYFDLKERVSDDYAEVILLTIKPNRSPFYNRAPKYIECLKEAFETFDKFPRQEEHIEHLKLGLFGMR